MLSAEDGETNSWRARREETLEAVRSCGRVNLGESCRWGSAVEGELGGLGDCRVEEGMVWSGGRWGGRNAGAGEETAVPGMKSGGGWGGAACFRFLDLSLMEE